MRAGARDRQDDLDAALEIQSTVVDGDFHPRYLDGKLFVTSFYNGSVLFGFDASGEQPKILWHGKWFDKGRNGAEMSANSDGLHSIISTPFMTPDTIYGVCSFGQLRAIDVKTGKRLWETFAATSGKERRWGNAFLVQHEDRYFISSETGDLIMARLTPEGYNELGRMLSSPDNKMPLAGCLVSSA